MIIVLDRTKKQVNRSGEYLAGFFAENPKQRSQ